MKQLALYFQANRLEKKAQWQQAAAIYQKIASVAKDNSGRLAYRQGMMAEKLKDWPNAQQFFSQAIAKRPHDANCFYHLGLAYEYDKKYQQAAKALEKSLAIKPNNPYALRHLGKVLIYGGDPAEGEGKLYQAIALRPDIDIFWQDLITAIRRQGRTWQEVEILQKRIEQQGKNVQLYFELGEAQDKMNRFAEAAQAFAQANVIRPGDAMWHFREGYAWERAGKAEKAQIAYTAAIAADKKLNAKVFGIGVFHQQRGYWPQAAEAYTKAAAADPTNAELQYRLGLAHDRCYRWEQATQSYKFALVFDPSKSHWHYRLGFVLERQGLLEQAAQAYEYAATIHDKHTSYWFYRLGYVLAKVGKYEQACQAFLRTRAEVELPEEIILKVGLHAQTILSKDYLENLKVNIASSQAQYAALCSEDPALTFYKLGNQAERLQMWEEAAQAYQAAVARSNNHNGSWYYRLGYVLMQMGRMEQAADAFVETRVLQKPYGVGDGVSRKYSMDHERRKLMEYNACLSLPIKKCCVLYESMHGASVGGNPNAIFRYILDHSKFNNWIHIWVLADGISKPEDLIQRPDVIFIKRHSYAYQRYLATCSYLVSDVTFPYWFIRRPEQKYLNTWHGTPLKKLGKDIPGEFMIHGNIQRNFLQATHLISPNVHTSDVLMHSYDQAGIGSAKLAGTGYPRIDITLNISNEERAATLARLGLQENVPVVLYAPTWRGVHGRAQFDFQRLQSDLAALTALPCQILFRGHHMVEKMLSSLELPVAIAHQDIDTSHVLAITDILVTDYSSIYFDFMPLDRPIFHYCYDWNKYAEERGLYFTQDELPGFFCESVQDLLISLKKQLAAPAHQPSQLYLDIKSRFCPYEDGRATARTVEFFFDDSDKHVITRYSDSRPFLMLSAGLFMPNGITTSYLNLVKALVKDNRYRLSVPIEADKIAAKPAWRAKFDELPKQIACLPRIGRMVMSPEAYWVKEKLDAWRDLPTSAMWKIIHQAYQQECARLYGATNQVDYFINFEGYSRFWTEFLGFGVPRGKNITYLHNDMLEEYYVKHPYLEALFNTYRYYDKLVSVSSHMANVNRHKLGARFDLASDKFTFCTNIINPDEIKARAQEPLDIDLIPWFESPYVFFTMGRLSPEKDHAKLLNAFVRTLQTTPDVRLVIMGDGPLRNKLNSQIIELGLQHSVFLAGQRTNPFPALARCSCFVLPSNHEGQPMVLLEAMTLQKSIIATDIDGNRGILEKYNGCLVENSIGGLIDGFKRFFKGDVQPLEFEASEYQKQALECFYSFLAGN